MQDINKGAEDVLAEFVAMIVMRELLNRVVTPDWLVAALKAEADAARRVMEEALQENG